MNRKVFEVDAHLKTRVVVEEGQKIEELVKKFLFEHPEKLEVETKFVCDCEDLGAWEVKEQE